MAMNTTMMKKKQVPQRELPKKKKGRKSPRSLKRLNRRSRRPLRFLQIRSRSLSRTQLIPYPRLAVRRQLYLRNRVVILNMKMRMIKVMERRTTMKRVDTSGARRATIGTGTIERTRRPTSGGTPCLTPSTPQFSLTRKPSRERWKLKRGSRVLALSPLSRRMRGLECTGLITERSKVPPP
jgi:hypothetical protein